MAEGILRHIAGDRADVYSAGIVKTGVNPVAIKVMNEKGIDISNQYSKNVTDLSGKKFDYVITVSDRTKQACPSFPGKYNEVHWNIDDPGEILGTDKDRLKAFREKRDLLFKAIKEFTAKQIFKE